MIFNYKLGLKMQEKVRLVSSGFNVIPAEEAESEGRMIRQDCAGALEANCYDFVEVVAVCRSAVD